MENEDLEFEECQEVDLEVRLKNGILEQTRPVPEITALDQDATVSEMDTNLALPIGYRQMQEPRVPILSVPFVPGIGDRLKRLADMYDVRTWFSFPGKPMDHFNQHRGKTHFSKSQCAVYCTSCICGVEYVGESLRNLKVRLSEHCQKSSASAFSMHIHQDDNDHAQNVQKTTIIATERNTIKRRIIETLCIHNKSAKICNSTTSIELPTIWEICEECVAKQLDLN